MIITRFSPSPSGFLHVGGARTALFNYLYARRHGGKFLLRIEDTDKAREVEGSAEALIDGLSWLGIRHDGPVVYQSKNAARHSKVADELVRRGAAYRCYSTSEEIAEDKARERREGRPERFYSPWRDTTIFPTDRPFVIRIKAPRDGETIIDDRVQGRVTVQNNELDDMVILRADGSPTYMLAVVVDDFDMGVNTIIRGDDHLNNAFRQSLIYRAMDWPQPIYAHIPLIHDSSGKKLSKRRQAVGIEHYRDDLGISSDALFNYLLRMGWGHGDDEIISRTQAIEWFDISDIVKSPARLDDKRLISINAHYLHARDDASLTLELAEALAKKIDRPLAAMEFTHLIRGVPSLKPRVKTMIELTDNAFFYLNIPSSMNPRYSLRSEYPWIDQLYDLLYWVEWSRDKLEEHLRLFSEKHSVKLNDVVKPMRLALTYSDKSPPIFDVMIALGRMMTIRRLSQAWGPARPILPYGEIIGAMTETQKSHLIARDPRLPAPMCRDCADEDGICPGDGLPCDDPGKVIATSIRILLRDGT